MKKNEFYVIFIKVPEEEEEMDSPNVVDGTFRGSFKGKFYEGEIHSNEDKAKELYKSAIGFEGSLKLKKIKITDVDV